MPNMLMLSVASVFLSLLSGCMMGGRERCPPVKVTARFASPEAAAGKTEYETDSLRLRLVDPTGRREPHGSLADMLAKLVVENKRDVFAWIKAERSCLIDPQDGTTNLLWRDACLPGKCWTRIAGPAPGFITINFPYFPYYGAERRPARPTGGTQRVLLSVAWEDGLSESVNLSYEVEVTASQATSE